jgi:hypothetical protein
MPAQEVLVTPEQKMLARHALGLDNEAANGQSYRNRYFASAKGRKGGPATREWKAMVAAGDATEAAFGSGGDRWMYALTKQGALKALEEGETLDPEDFPNGS